MTTTGVNNGVNVQALLDAREVEIGIGPGARIAPCAGVDTGRPHKGVELDLARGHGRSVA